MTAVTLTAGFGLAVFYAPIDADQGFLQKIFYVHVPLAIVTLGGFVFGGIWPSSICARATRGTTCAATWRSTRR